MLTPEEKIMLTDLSTMPHGLVLQKLIKSEIADLKDVTTAKNWEETLGKQYAVKTLEKIISYIEADKPTKTPKISYE